MDKRMMIVGVVWLMACGAAEPTEPDCSRAYCKIVLVADNQGHLSDPAKLACIVDTEGCFQSACIDRPGYEKWCGVKEK